MGTKALFSRIDTAANFTSANPVLSLGETGYEQDTERLKVGDGVTAWNALDYKFEGASAHSELILDDGTNPHGTTKADVGLGNVDNTSDADKPVSTAQQAALDLKYDASNPANYIDAAGAPVQPADIADFETTAELNARDAANRDRANHTGTQTASTISDFDIEVSNNPDVALNTTKVSFPEAPNDGALYARQSLGWTPFTPGVDGFAVFSIWAEENAVLSDNTYEWAFGNGGNTPNNGGVAAPVACELFAISLYSTTAGTSTVVSVENNGINVAQHMPMTGNNIFTVLPVPVAFQQGDRVNFRTLVAGGAANAVVTAHFRRLAQVQAVNPYLFWTSTTPTSTALPAVNQPLNPPTPTATIFAPNGEIVDNNNGTFTLQGGPNGSGYKAIGVIRGSNFDNANVFYGTRFKDTALNAFGNQSVVYSNASLNLFSHQPFSSAMIEVAANTTLTVGLYLDFIVGGSAEYTPSRSFMSLEKLR